MAHRRLHTANHLMYAGLKIVVGDHVTQHGSNITEERLRFDFNNDEKVTREQLDEVERMVNAWIDADVAVSYEEYPTDGDIVMGAPHSGLIAAIGYAEASQIPYKDGIIKNRYIGRKFLTTNEEERLKDIYIKLNPVKEVLKDQRIILIDDSIIKGSTSRRTVKMLREAGAKEVHVRISSPMYRYTCNLSMDVPQEEALMAHNKTCEQIRKEIGADSLYYLSYEGLLEACKGSEFCDHCITGNYPIDYSEN